MHSEVHRQQAHGRRPLKSDPDLIPDEVLADQVEPIVSSTSMIAAQLCAWILGNRRAADSAHRNLVLHSSSVLSRSQDLRTTSRVAQRLGAVSSYLSYLYSPKGGESLAVLVECCLRSSDVH